MSLLC